MNNQPIPAAVQDLFSAICDPAQVRMAGANTPVAAPIVPELADGEPRLSADLRFAIESRLDALSSILADIDRRRPEMWKATDLACQCLDEVQILLNAA